MDELVIQPGVYTGTVYNKVFITALDKYKEAKTDLKDVEVLYYCKNP